MNLERALKADGRNSGAVKFSQFISSFERATQLLLSVLFNITIFSIRHFKGHFVQGHVDCTGDIVEKFKEGDSLWFKVLLPPVPLSFLSTFVCEESRTFHKCSVVLFG